MKPTLKKIAAIKSLVAEAYGTTVKEIDGRGRQATLAQARHVAIYLVRECFTPAPSLSEIAAIFKRDHHGTIINSLTVIKDRAEVDKWFAGHVSNLRNQVSEKLTSAA